MEAQISTSEGGIEDVYTRRGNHYPTRNDSIMSFQDRHDWIVVARDIMTKGDKYPENISKIASSGSSRVEVIKSFISQKPQRSLWNILIGIFNSAQRTKITMPTVPEMDALFEELNPPKPSPALEQYKAAHPVPEGFQDVVTPRKHLLELPIVPHTSRRTRGVLAHSEDQDNSVAVYYSHFTPKLQEVFRLFYGYIGAGDPADPTSYNGHRRSLPMIATELGLSYQTVYARFQKISQIISGLRQQQGDNPEASDEMSSIVNGNTDEVRRILEAPKKNALEMLPDVTHVETLTSGRRADFFAYYGYKGAPHDPTLPTSYDPALRQSFEKIANRRGANKTAVYMQVYTAYKKLQELSPPKLSEDIPIEKTPAIAEVQIPSFLKKPRREVAPLPKRQSEIVPEYRGETAPTQGTVSRVIQTAQPPVPAKFITPTPPKQTPEVEFSFEELVLNSSDVRTIPKKHEIQATPVIKKQLREIPEFNSYREALEWGKKQTDWLGAIELWKKSTPPVQRDNLGVLTYLRISRNTELQSFLDAVRAVSGDLRLKYIKIFDDLCAPLPEEKPSIIDIQGNTGWMTLIENAFQKHESGDHAGFMGSLLTILADEVLASKVFDLMPEYEAEDYVDILALIVGKNWGKKDALPYGNRTLREMIGYKPGKYVGLDAILEKGSHVGKKMLVTGLSDIMLKVPLGKTIWSRFQEKDVPEVSLYDIIVSLVKEEERESSKILFHTLESILELKKK